MFRKYEDFGVEDFVADEYFWKWVKEPTQEISEFWETWIRLHPHKKSIVLEARQLLLSIDFKKTAPADIDAETLLHRIRASIAMGQRIVDMPVEQPSPWRRWAAAILITAVSGFTLFYFISRQTERRIDLRTAYGENETVVLPDSSTVVLNANSTLEYDKNWNESKVREVWLQGEAFFEVKKSPGKGNAKFIVHTDRLAVEVLGTEFNVTNRHGRTQVVLNSGKVRLRSDQTVEKEVMMKPGELAELESNQNKIVKRIVNPETYSAWTQGKFIFNKTSLSEIVAMIEDNYGYQVQLDVAGIGNETFTGVIPTGDLDNLLNVLAESYEVKITKARGKLWITRK